MLVLLILVVFLYRSNNTIRLTDVHTLRYWFDYINYFYNNKLKKMKIIIYYY